MKENEKMKKNSFLLFQLLVFLPVSAAFTNIYITQPVLPLITKEFNVSETTASLTVSMVILGIVLSNLPFGKLSDRISIRHIIACGSGLMIIGGMICFFSRSPYTLIIGRFIQGLFTPSLTTCIAAYLSKSLPSERLNVAMGSYVSATVVGGLGGRLIGGWIHSPEHWRNAFLTTSTLLLISGLAAIIFLPADDVEKIADKKEKSFMELLKRPELLRNFLVAFGGFFVFSSSFNYMPFYLSGPPFNASTRIITLLYLSYIVGVLIGPLSGKLSNRIGNGKTMMAGSIILAAALLFSLVGSLWAILLSLCGICGGFFATHSSAAGAMNRRLTESRGKANALYVLFYYIGGYTGITLSGFSYERFGWPGVISLGIVVLMIPFSVGFVENRRK